MNIYQCCLVLGFILLLLVLYFIKQRKIEFSYGILWFFISVYLIIMALQPTLLEYIASFFGILYAPSLLFVGGVFFNMIIVLYLTIQNSKMRITVTRLTQEIGILKSKFDNEVER